MHISTILAIASAVAPLASASCCFRADNGYCADGTWGTPCCGYGKCNIFCCACKGGCRHSRAGAAAAGLVGNDGITDAKAFELARVEAGSDNLTLSQYAAHMKADPQDAVYVDWFNKHDKNGDGVISADEVRLE